MDPQYQAPQYAEGQTVPFGGGQFQWTGQGWHDPRTGRQFDPTGNILPAPQQQVQPSYPQQYQQPGYPQQYQPTPAVQQQQAYANPLVDFFKKNSGINVNAYNFNKLKQSTQDLTLAAAEAAGHDKNDVLQDISRTLPRATGPRSGYVAPLGAR